LHWAAKRGHTKIAGLLLDYGADTDALDLVNSSLYNGINFLREGKLLYIML